MYTMDVANTQLWLHVFASTSLWRMDVTVNQITFHIAGRVIKHEGLKEPYPSPFSLTHLARSATSLPDRNFHTSGDCAAATDPYVPGFNSSRVHPHHTKESHMPEAF